MKADLSESRGLSATTARRLSAGLIGFALVGSAALVSAPAHATAAATSGAHASAAAKQCLTPPARATTWRRGADTSEVSPAVKAQVARDLAATRQSLATDPATPSFARTSGLPATIHVPVIIHIIHGRHRGESRIQKRGARRMFYILKGGFAGSQNSAMPPTGVVFDFRRITVTRNERWFHAAPFSRADRQMKHRLHRGNARVLNIYVNRPKSGGQLLLGYSLFPWQWAAHPSLDGVTISEVGLPGGRAHGYNLGDTVIHETGHWMGLLHTFEGGCSGSGDGVADTPSEATPSFTCPVGRNTCPDPDLPPVAPSVTPTPNPIPDPVTNFMDYSYDTCMDNFTPGQVTRMKTAYMRYRYGH